MNKPNSFRAAVDALLGKKPEVEANASPVQEAEQTSEEVTALVAEIATLKNQITAITEASQRQLDVITALPEVIAKLTSEIDAIKKSPVEPSTVAVASSNQEPSFQAKEEVLDEDSRKVMEVMKYVNSVLSQQ